MAGMIEKLAASLRGRQQKRRQERLAKVDAYWQLVRDVHDGTARSAEEVEQLLAEANKSIEQLEADVALLGTRIQDFELLSREKADQEELGTIRATIERETAKFEAVAKRFRETIEALNARDLELQTRSIEYGRVRERLTANCPYAAKGKLLELEERRVALSRKHMEAQRDVYGQYPTTREGAWENSTLERLQKLESDVRMAEAREKTVAGSAALATALANLEAFRPVYAEKERQVAALAAELADVERQLAAAAEEVLQP